MRKILKSLFTVAAAIIVVMVISILNPNTLSLMLVGRLEAFKIPSSAMEPTLVPGDHVMVSLTSYQGDAPKRNDIVVFTLPSDPNVNWIKRIVALGGDTVELRGKELLINGGVVPESFAQYRFGGRKDFPQTQVPDGRVFVLGDNRDESKDSRYLADPFIEVNRLKGKALFVYWNSLMRSGRVGRSLTK